MSTRTPSRANSSARPPSAGTTATTARRPATGAGGRDRRERGDRDAVRPAGLDAGLDRRADVGDVHVDVPLPAGRGVDADHDQAVAERRRAALQPGDGRLVGVGEQVLHLAARARRGGWCGASLGRAAGARGRGGRSGGRTGLDAGRPRRPGRRAQARARAAGVHDPGLAEHGELVGGVLERDAGAVGGGPDDVGQLGAALVDRGDRGLAPPRATVRNVPSSGSATAV